MPTDTEKEDDVGEVFEEEQNGFEENKFSRLKTLLTDQKTQKLRKVDWKITIVFTAIPKFKKIVWICKVCNLQFRPVRDR